MSRASRLTEKRQQQWVHCWAPLFRLFWLLLFLIHLVPVYAVSQRFLKSPSLGNVVSLFVLFGILTLSALKALDVACLRIPLNRRSVLGLVLLAMWVHGDFVAHKLPDAITIESTIAISVVVIAALRRRWEPRFTSLAAFLLRLKQAFHAVIDTPMTSRTPLVLLHQVPPRAPPRR